MYYPDDIIEKVRSANDIVDVIGRYVKIQKKGNSYFGLCPFHNEKSPSFSVSQSKQMYHCFGCTAGGNVITFLMQYENLTFQEAVKMLAERAGIELPEPEYSEEAKQKKDRRNRLMEVNKEAAKYFYYQLRAPQGKKGLDYFTERKLSEDTMKQFGLGYANVTSDDLAKYLKTKGFEDDLIIEAGLATFDEKYGLHDKFWNRVMFPIQDVTGKVIGFGGRVMGDAKPKYLNSPDTPVFDKSRNLYGLNFARSSRSKYFILCEGYMDVIAMHQAGFNMAVASLGTAFTAGQANLLRRYAEEVILAYDSDEAGIKAALRAIEILNEVDLTARVLSLEPYKDPDEFIKGLGRDEFMERISRAKNSFFFELEVLSRNYDLNDPESKTKFHNEIAKKLCAFTQEVKRDNYIEAVCDKYGIGPEAMRKLITSYAMKTGDVRPVERPKSGIAPKNAEGEGKRAVQRLFLTWIVDSPGIYQKVKKYVSPEDFTEEIFRKVAEVLFKQIESDSLNPASIISMFDDEESQKTAASVFNERLRSVESRSEKEKAFHDILYSLKKNSYDYYSSKLGSDVDALKQVIDGKKALEEINKIHISLEDEK
ncbi:MAG: DNA primase [Lachnospiraceae bacterium]|nr:DNA primase [Lachnospiraceae bacterium]